MCTPIRYLITVTVSVYIIWGCNGKEAVEKAENHDEHNKVVKLFAESVEQIQIKTETVRVQQFIRYLTIPAKVIANQNNEAQIGSPVQGRVQQVYVNLGDYVKAGQILLTVEGLDIGEIKAGFLIAKAALDYATVSYERQKKLFDEKIGSQKALSESKAEFEKALVEYKAEDEKIHSVGLSDTDITNGKPGTEHTSGSLPIKSPIHGIVVERNIVIGQYIDATTNAFRIINMNPVWIDGQIYEKDLPGLMHLRTAEFVALPYPDEKFQGRIIYVGQTVDERTRTITVRGEFNNSLHKLKPQMFGDLKIPTDVKSAALLIPGEAVINETGKSYVFVQSNDTTFERRDVVTGAEMDNWIEIKEGVQSGEKIVVKGVFYLKSELKKEEIAGDEH